MSKMHEYWVLEILKTRRIICTMPGNNVRVEYVYHKNFTRIITSDASLAEQMMHDRSEILKGIIIGSYGYCYPFNDQLVAYNVPDISARGMTSLHWDEDETMKAMKDMAMFIQMELEDE